VDEKTARLKALRLAQHELQTAEQSSGSANRQKRNRNDLNRAAR
jgi:hypothetical protein